MYSNKEHVNLLTALLAKHGVQHAVVCPGSRNAPIVHNLNEHPAITCYPVTDERSAGFYALGMAQATRKPVVVCVTSGTALLNLLPAVAEACYQHLPLVVVSADRPPQWIGQLDGQTLPQPDALGKFVRKAVTLPEPHNDEERWYASRLVNEALLAVCHHGCGPVHINVPISEPLYAFTCTQLPVVEPMKRLQQQTDGAGLESLVLRPFFQASRPMLVVGQTSDLDTIDKTVAARVNDYAVVLHEPLSGLPTRCALDIALLMAGQDECFRPDFVIYVGGTLVSKRMKRFLRQLPRSATTIWMVNSDGAIEDVTQQAIGVAEVAPADLFVAIDSVLSQGRLLHVDGGDDFRIDRRRTAAYVERWQTLLDAAVQGTQAYEPRYSQLAAVKRFETLAARLPACQIHYANSMAVRLGCIYGRRAWCNRGVNGIEGSLSAAAGMSVVTGDTVFCVIGDLSFFYDQNALWNQNLRGNLRILLLNNGGGGIFGRFDGLRESGARDRLVMAKHQATAEGICRQNNIGYQAAHDMDALREGLDWLAAPQGHRPALLEVFTDAECDQEVYDDYISTMGHQHHTTA